MTTDSVPPPMPSLSTQVAALVAAFPGYRFAVVSHGDAQGIEVTRRDDHGPVPNWLLISSDARRIWDELKAAA